MGSNSDPTPAGLAPSNVDLGSETVQGMGFELMYKANLKVLKSADDLMKSTLDLKG